jgi:hypothetical protein
MLKEISNSREVIKNRMLKHALNNWNLKNTDDMDPAVKLIMEALALEIHNLGNEIEDTQSRILEKIANLLSPDFLTAPNPTHALLHVSPVEPQEILTNTTAFFMQRKISLRQNEVLDSTVDVHFTPLAPIKIIDAEVACMATGENLYAYDTSFKKQLIARSKTGLVESNSLWLGLKINPKIEDISNVSFCFDWKNLEPKIAHRIYQFLPITTWSLNDAQIETQPGIKWESYVDTDRYENMFLEYDLLSLMEKDIGNFYDQQFITVFDKETRVRNEMMQAYPAVFKNLFAENDLQKLTDNLLWIKIVFPAAMQQDHLDEVYAYLNTFPVMNRRLNDLKYRLKGGSNVIPLRTPALEQFLSVKSLSDEKHQYKSVPYRKKEEEEIGTYTLRRGGVERFDSRNAREMISNLLELLRSESSAFAAYGYDFIATTLREMDQRIALMEEKTKGYINNATEIPNYIITKPFEGYDMMYAEFWTTLAELANNIRSGAKLQQAKGVKVKPDSVTLMSTTIGGKNRLRPEERVNAFKYGIMTRDRIVTKEDIRNFCFYELGNRISRVEVTRGFKMEEHSKQAFKRTIDVWLTPSETERLETKEWELICEQLKSKLQSRSGITNHYRIQMQHQ